MNQSRPTGLAAIVVAVAADAEAEKKQKRREQWKINQRNSRLKRTSQAKTLEAENSAREREIDALQNQLAQLQRAVTVTAVHRPPISGTGAVRVIEEYYKMFSNGFATNAALQAQQRAFVQSIMTEQTRFMDTQGADSVLEQWRLMTSSHKTLRIVPLTCTLMKEEEGVVVCAVSRYLCRISRKTLSHLYPHVLSNERLAQALIDQEIVAIDTVHSYFDDDGKIVRHDVVIDFISPLLELLGNVDDVASVLSDAHLTNIGLFDKTRNKNSPLLKCQGEPKAARALEPLVAYPKTARTLESFVEPYPKRMCRDNSVQMLLSN